MQTVETTTSSPNSTNAVLAADAAKDGIAVYCKGSCEGIIYAVTNKGYKDKEAKKEIDWYWNNGYRMGIVSKREVQEKFGCTCKK